MMYGHMLSMVIWPRKKRKPSQLHRLRTVLDDRFLALARENGAYGDSNMPAYTQGECDTLLWAINCCDAIEVEDTA